MVQGAHFLTHTLWSGLVCWTVIALLYVAMLRATGAPATVPAR
jgi:membrane-associated PAP2 superfamily phosphatase